MSFLPKTSIGRHKICIVIKRSNSSGFHLYGYIANFRKVDLGPDQHHVGSSQHIRRADQPEPDDPGRPAQAHRVRDHRQGSNPYTKDSISTNNEIKKNKVAEVKI